MKRVFRLKKKFLLTFVVLIAIIFGGFIYFKLSKDKDIDINKVLESSSYSYLPVEAKNFIIEAYEKTGDVVLTEKNKKDGVAYLNPEFVDYLTLSDDEKNASSLIPETYIFDYTSTGDITDDLPSKYNLGDVDGKNFISEVKNQGNLGICWSFASYGQIESKLLISSNKSYDSSSQLFSERQMDYATSNNGIKNYDNKMGFRALGSGGNFTISSYAMASGLTMVDDSLMGYSSSLEQLEYSKVLNDKNSLYEVNSAIKVPVLNIVDLDLTNSDDIKKRDSYLSLIKTNVIKNGGAYVGTESPQSSCSILTDDSAVIRVDNYCVQNSSHAMQIVGWDDDYEYKYCHDSNSHSKYTSSCSSDNTVTGKGAWILKNSWGANRYPYVYLAYDSLDSDIGLVTELSSASDKNWNGYYSTNFLKKPYYYITSNLHIDYKRASASSEKLMKVKFITTSSDASYTVYVNNNKVKTLDGDNPGLYTVDFSNDDIVLADESFLIKILGSNGGLLVDGAQVFTKTVDSKQEINTKDSYFRSTLSTKNSDNYEFSVSTNTKNINSGEILNYKLYDSAGVDISSKLSVTNNVVSANFVNAFFTIDNSVPVGVYTLHTLYGELDAESKITLYPIKEIVGDGVENSPYIITSVVELETLGDQPDAYFKLGNDISSVDGYSWSPVEFYGNFDGSGYIISGLDDSLFSTVSANENAPTIIRNLTLKDFTTSDKGAFSKEVIDYIDHNLSTSDYGVLIENIAIMGDDINIKNGSFIGDISLRDKNKLLINGIFSSTINHSNYPWLINSIDGSSGTALSISNIEVLGKFNISEKSYRQGLLIDNVGAGLTLNNFVIASDNASSDYSDYNSIIGRVYPDVVDNVTLENGYYTSGTGTFSIYDTTNKTLEDGIVDSTINKTNITNLNDVNLYLVWASFSKYWKSDNINGISRIPILNFVNFEYTNVSDITLNKGDNYNLFTAITPNSLFAKNISFEMADNSIASIDKDGNITALDVGKTTIHVVSNYDGYERDVDLTVVGSENYTINYDSNNGTGDVISETVPVDTIVKTKSNIFSKSGYKFVGWNTAQDGSGDSYAGNAEIENIALAGETIVLYAQWEAIEYTVIYDNNGGSGSIDDFKVYYDQEFLLPDNTFVRKGYKFTGWNTESDGTGTSYNDKATVKNLTTNETVTLYAQWTIITYTIRYNSNGGLGTMDDVVLTYNDDTYLSSNLYEKRGYRFVGWNTKSDGTGDDFDDKQYVRELTDVDGSVIVLYAQWKVINYVVRYEGNGGYGQMPDQSFTYENLSKLYSNSFERVGYTFSSWCTNADGNGDIYSDNANLEDINYYGESSITLYAQWVPIQYTVQFNSNGGEGEMSDDVFEYGHLYNLSFNNFTRYGYNFVNWNTKADGTGYYYNDNSEVSNLLDKNATLVLYAQWEAIEYEVRFDANGGDGQMLNQHLTYDKVDYLEKNKFTKNGYTFIGWNTMIDGTGTSYDDEAEVLNILDADGDITLYAQWMIAGYEVTFNPNGGEGEMLNQIFEFDIAKQLYTNTYTKLGYKFTSWNTKADGTGENYSNKEIVTNLTDKNETITLYAQWVPISYEIKFVGNDAVGEMPNQIFKYDVKSSLVANAYTKEGYKFVGWNTVLDGSGSVYNDGDDIFNLTDKDGSIIYLYAQWVPIQYTVQFNSNGGEGEMPNQILNYDNIVNLNENTYTKVGYSFVEWNLKADGTGDSYKDKAEIYNLTDSGETIVFYAIWSPISYTVKFDNNGTSGELSDITLKYDESRKVSTDGFVKKGYILDSWNTKADGTGSSYSISKELINLSATDGDVIILYAQYVPIHYTIAFMPNGASGTMDNQEFIYDTEAALNKNTFVRVGYYFKEWNTKADGTGKSYKDQQIINNITSNNENIILYAIWKLDVDYEIKDYILDSNNYLRNIKPNTKLKEYLTKFDIGKDYNIAVYDLDDKLLDEDDLVFTGSITKIMKNDDVILEIKNIIMGDVNGDGKVTTADVSKVYRHIKKRINISEDCYLLASDVNGDAKVSTADVSKIYRFVKKRIDSLD